MIQYSTEMFSDIENEARARWRLDVFLRQQSAKNCVIIDFDECLIDIHLSSQLTMEYIHRVDPSSVDFGDYSLAAISSILQCYVGLSRNEIASTCGRLAAKARWRPHALELLNFLISDPDYSVLIMSSGLDMAIDAKISSSCLSISRIACEMEFDKAETCIRPYLIVTGDVKGRLTRHVVASKRFESVFAVGHSRGDISMLRSGIGIAFEGVLEVEESAQYVVSDFTEIRQLVQTGTR